MLRLVLTALFCLGVAGCGAPVFPSGGPSAPPTPSDFRALGITGAAVAGISYLLLRRSGRAALANTSRPRGLLAILVVSVTSTGLLSIAYGLLDSPGPSYRGIHASLAAIAFAALLRMQLHSAIDAGRSLVVARVGAFLAVAFVPVWLVAVWVEAGGEWIWPLAWTLATLAAGAAHATYLARPGLRIGHRWLVPTTLVAVAALVGFYVVVLWTSPQWNEFGGRIFKALLATTITGTLLCIVCRRLDPAPAKDDSPSLDRPRP